VVWPRWVSACRGVVPWVWVQGSRVWMGKGYLHSWGRFFWYGPFMGTDVPLAHFSVICSQLCSCCIIYGLPQFQGTWWPACHLAKATAVWGIDVNCTAARKMAWHCCWSAHEGCCPSPPMFTSALSQLFWICEPWSRADPNTQKFRYCDITQPCISSLPQPSRNAAAFLFSQRRKPSQQSLDTQLWSHSWL
jgi:hypothetical protein